MSHLPQRGPVQVTLENGMLRLRRGNPQAEGLYDPDTTNALRAFFQAERDEQLGRWRDPENPDWVVYRTPEYDDDDGRCILLLDETTGGTDHEWEQTDLPGPARHYFAAHPEPKPHPWEEAKPGEIWEIGLLELGPSACLVTKGDFVEISGRFEVAIGSSLIKSGRRIWPEPRIGGTE